MSPRRETSTVKVCVRCSSRGLEVSIAFATISHLDAFPFQLHFPASAGDVEQIVDEPGQMIDLPRDNCAFAFDRPVAPQCHQLHGGLNRRQGIAQLMAEHCGELVLRPVRSCCGIAEVLHLLSDSPPVGSTVMSIQDSPRARRAVATVGA
jgi:hypothetical protein